jgi:hypothetical protein
MQYRSRAPAVSTPQRSTRALPLYRWEQREKRGVLDLNTSAGPVIIYVRQSLNFKSTIRINGADRSFFLSYFGTGATSTESPFKGTIVAPNAALRLAPVGSAGHHGSFFAKSIDAAEARQHHLRPVRLLVALRLATRQLTLVYGCEREKSPRGATRSSVIPACGRRPVAVPVAAVSR